LKSYLEGEGKVPIPGEEWFEVTYGRKWRPVGRFLLPIDLCLLPKGKDSTFVLNNQDRFEHIGIEVKYNLKGNKKELAKQLSRYAESKAITRLYLATIDRNISIAKGLDGVGKKFGIIRYTGNEGVIVEIESPKLPMEFDGFGYYGLEGVRIWKVGSSTFIPLPRNREFIEKRFLRAIIYGSSKGKCHTEQDITFKIFKSGNIEVQYGR
jgi:hypothetical protein